ncbi:MAG TPA: PIN domain-containing protein [Ktedonobacteraceae bacterium]|nr:PIN domain-containing protein [Ktedonobacteraceae bacterium]
MSINTISRIIGSLVALGIVISLYFFDHTTSTLPIAWVVGIAIGSTLIAFIITPYITVVPYRWMRDTSASDLIAAIIGLTVGLIISSLLAIPLAPLANLPTNLGHILPFVVAVVFSFLGITLAVQRKNDMVHLFQTGFLARRREREREREEERERDKGNKDHDKESPVQKAAEPQILLDTSAIIDGRIADISQTGFVYGTLIVPQFVLNELQRIADSADAMRRNRGRRGLEMLNRLQKDTTVPIEIVDTDVEDVAEVDGKLVKLARIQHCPIITNDFNLNRVAELQGVKVLNINELANAVKPVLLPGEDLPIRIMQDGKELGQGVGYLDDGTMIVVEGGRQFMNMTVEVTVTRVLQTVAGRMIFAHPKQNSNNMPNPAPQSSTKQKLY